jgi:hypothetical protein
MISPVYSAGTVGGIWAAVSAKRGEAMPGQVGMLISHFRTVGKYRGGPSTPDHSD